MPKLSALIVVSYLTFFVSCWFSTLIKTRMVSYTWSSAQPEESTTRVMPSVNWFPFTLTVGAVWESFLTIAITWDMGHFTTLLIYALIGGWFAFEDWWLALLRHQPVELYPAWALDPDGKMRSFLKRAHHEGSWAVILVLFGCVALTGACGLLIVVASLALYGFDRFVTTFGWVFLSLWEVGVGGIVGAVAIVALREQRRTGILYN